MESTALFIGILVAFAAAGLAVVLWNQRSYLGREWRSLMADYQSGKNPRDGQKVRYQSAVTEQVQARGPGGGRRRTRGKAKGRRQS